tara:strand:- start:1414 stop:2646 length:1233 start_codon:yes stop_codon:yes gene_type:complete
MPLFGLKRAKQRYGAIIDIGSGSVLVAVVHSDPSKEHPDIVWSHREHAPLKNVDTLEQSAKAVMAALVSASMQLDGEGRKAMYDFAKVSTFDKIQCSIAAPWSYTVTKTINYKQEEVFDVTRELLDELTRTVQEKIESELKENEALQNLGLDIITRATMDITANGYHVKKLKNNKAKELVISRASAVAQKYLVEAINEMRDKLFPAAEMRNISFILMLYMVTRDLFQDQYDVCLVDITYEATEMGVMRDGVMSYCTHTPFGTFSLARELATATGVPLHEAFGYLHTENPYSFMENLGPKQKEDVRTVFDAFVSRVTDLFHETGDPLAIPRKISLHTDLKSETLFKDLIQKAAKRSLQAEANIIPISKEIIKRTYAESTKNAPKSMPSDTALLLSAQFFHKQPEYSMFEYL